MINVDGAPDSADRLNESPSAMDRTSGGGGSGFPMPSGGPVGFKNLLGNTLKPSSGSDFAPLKSARGVAGTGLGGLGGVIQP